LSLWLGELQKKRSRSPLSGGLAPINQCLELLPGQIIVLAPMSSLIAGVAGRDDVSVAIGAAVLLGDRVFSGTPQRFCLSVGETKQLAQARLVTFEHWQAAVEAEAMLLNIGSEATIFESECH
jgi:hypothetical protein